MSTSDIAIHDLQMTIEHGLNDVCETVTKVGAHELVYESVVMDAIDNCTSPVVSEDGFPVVGGHVATKPFVIVLASGQSVAVGTNDEILIRNGVMKIRDHASDAVTTMATLEVSIVKYEVSTVHLW